MLMNHIVTGWDKVGDEFFTKRCWMLSGQCTAGLLIQTKVW
jgi:hypothetical protein